MPSVQQSLLSFVTDHGSNPLNLHFKRDWFFFENSNYFLCHDCPNWPSTFKVKELAWKFVKGMFTLIKTAKKHTSNFPLSALLWFVVETENCKNRSNLQTKRKTSELSRNENFSILLNQQQEIHLGKQIFPLSASSSEWVFIKKKVFIQTSGR